MDAVNLTCVTFSRLDEVSAVCSATAQQVIVAALRMLMTMPLPLEETDVVAKHGLLRAEVSAQSAVTI